LFFNREEAKIMKRKLATLLILVLVFSVFTGCTKTRYKSDGVNLTLEIEGEGNVDGLREGKNFVQRGAVVDLKAVPDDGWEFEKWIGSVVENKNRAETRATLTKDSSIKVVFKEKDPEPDPEPDPSISSISITEVGEMEYRFRVSDYEGDIDSFSWEILDSKANLITKGSGKSFTHHFSESYRGEVITAIAFGHFNGDRTSHSKAYKLP